MMTSCDEQSGVNQRNSARSGKVSVHDIESIELG